MKKIDKFISKAKLACIVAGLLLAPLVVFVGCGENPETTQVNVALCKKCGEIKGADKCCKEEGRTKCGKCGLFEGSPGCCKLPKAKDEHSHIHSDTDGVFALCHKCGEVVGTDKCCKKEGRTKCEKCGLFDGSPGCCKLNGATANVALCKKCGEIKGSDKCCKEEGRKKCEKCGLFEGSPGCCKLPKVKKETKVKTEAPANKEGEKDE